MTLGLRRLLPCLMMSATLLLAGCQSSEEKAEDYYQSGLTLLAAGDVDRALVEFRNVFKYNGFHKEARKTYADAVLARGDVADAYSQYLRLIEQYPDTVEVRRTLATLAIGRGDWAEAERHGQAALKLTPDDPATQAIGAALDYRKGIMDRDAALQAAAVTRAQQIQALLPEDPVARRIIVDARINGPDPQSALPEIEKALQAEPRSLEYNGLKLRLLAGRNDRAATGAQLKRMVEFFPDNTEVRGALIHWYMAEQDYAGAEAFLRQLAGPDTANPEGHAAVVQLLRQTQGVEAARAELDRLIAANTEQAGREFYVAMRAGMNFETGAQGEGIAEIEALLKAAQPSDQTRRIKVMLAQMLLSTGNPVGARACVEEVLAEDASNVEALKMRAAWLIGEDKPTAAIIDLRAALNQNPRDASVMLLLAAAHERDGNTDLAAEQLAKAVEASGNGAEESLRYAEFLLRHNRPQVAATVLADARRANPAHVGVLARLGELRLRQQDFPGTQDIIDSLAALDAPEARGAVLALQPALLQAQNRQAEGLTFLKGELGKGGGDLRATILLIESQLRAGQIPEARATLETALTRAPDSPALHLIRANLLSIAGDVAAAETELRKLIAADPGAEAPVRMLYNLLRADGRAEAADQLLQEALAARPESFTLRWVEAGALEARGDIDGAIAVYEGLYARNSSDVVVANNLASLLTAHRDDAASLERAYTIARRLRDTEVPAFQDTYGWIAYRRGNLDEALAQLEPAARALARDPMVQFHLGMVYAGLKRDAEARATLGRALELAGDSPLPQFATARETLKALEGGGAAAAPAPGSTTGTGGQP